MLSASLLFMIAKKSAVKSKRNDRPNLADVDRKAELNENTFATGVARFYQFHGFNINPYQSFLFTSAIIVILAAVWIRYGVLFALFSFMLIYAVFKINKLKSRGSTKVQFLFFLEDFNREMSAGFNLELAFRRVALRMNDPLKSIFMRVLARRDLGTDLDKALAAEANALRLSEMQLLSTLIKVNQHYGGRLSESLVSLTNLLRQQDKSERELAAMTGETRVTAVVLCLMPLLIGGYMMLTNPDFSEVMFTSTAGNISLAIALSLQVTGIFLIWRMLRSV